MVRLYLLNILFYFLGFIQICWKKILRVPIHVVNGIIALATNCKYACFKWFTFNFQCSVRYFNKYEKFHLYYTTSTTITLLYYNYYHYYYTIIVVYGVKSANNRCHAIAHYSINNVIMLNSHLPVCLASIGLVQRPS